MSKAPVPGPSLTPRELLTAWGRILAGRIPLLSIEITRECPLRCPGCYAFGDMHLGGGVTLTELVDFRGDALVEGVLRLVREHRPLHVSIVGGEPLVRHRELSRILPELGRMGIFTLVVTSAVIPIPRDWMELPRFRVAVSVDGLPEDHDQRRKPATYERILKNIEGRQVNVHWVITRPMLSRPGYLEEYVAFWSARPEVNRIWVSVYTPQIGERSAETLTPVDRAAIARELPELARRYPKLLFREGFGRALVRPPQNPADCVFSKMSTNYSADLRSRVEPCVFGGSPDCSQCGCAISTGLHWVRDINVAGPVKIDHLVAASLRIGRTVNRLRAKEPPPPRWSSRSSSSTSHSSARELVQIGCEDTRAADADAPSRSQPRTSAAVPPTATPPCAEHDVHTGMER
ncbi:MAG TPA: radical SAM protein [Candidatus Acidoferrales bacterium]|nr:radical SAM protein [Candidatus Acidoferrales bacterium]